MGRLPSPVRGEMSVRMSRPAASPASVVSPTGYGAALFSPQCRPLLVMPPVVEGVAEN
jgi:hypothetical protein